MPKTCVAKAGAWLSLVISGHSARALPGAARGISGQKPQNRAWEFLVDGRYLHMLRKPFLFPKRKRNRLKYMHRVALPCNKVHHHFMADHHVSTEICDMAMGPNL
jgi:hypothetical protein